MSKGVRFLLNKNKIDLIPGFGRLTAPGRIDVDGAEYEADHIVLATGARPREMAFMPIDGERVISSRQALTLTQLPETMTVEGTDAEFEIERPKGDTEEVIVDTEQLNLF